MSTQGSLRDSVAAEAEAILLSVVHTVPDPLTGLRLACPAGRGTLA